MGGTCSNISDSVVEIICDGPLPNLKLWKVGRPHLRKTFVEVLKFTNYKIYAMNLIAPQHIVQSLAFEERDEFKRNYVILVCYPGNIGIPDYSRQILLVSGTVFMSMTINAILEDVSRFSTYDNALMPIIEKVHIQINGPFCELDCGNSPNGLFRLFKKRNGKISQGSITSVLKSMGAIVKTGKTIKQNVLAVLVSNTNKNCFKWHYIPLWKLLNLCKKINIESLNNKHNITVNT